MSDDMKIDLTRHYTTSTAARLLGVSASTLRDLERRGRLNCARTPGGQRRFAGAELLRLREESMGSPPKTPRTTSGHVAATIEDAKARQAWLGALIAGAQRELSTDTPAEIRLRLAADLERALRNVGPASPMADVEPLVTRVIDEARRQVREAQEEAQRRQTKDQLLDHAQAHLHRRIQALPRRVVGAPGSLKRVDVRATLRDQLRALLQKRLTGDEPWHQVRDLGDEFVAAWYVRQTPGRRIPDIVKILAAGATGVVGGAATVATIDPRIRAQIRATAGKLKNPLLLLAFDLLELLKHSNAPPASASPAPNPTNQATTPPPPGPSPGSVGVWLPAYRRAPTTRHGYSAPRRMMTQPIEESRAHLGEENPSHGSPSIHQASR